MFKDAFQELGNSAKNIAKQQLASFGKDAVQALGINHEDFVDSGKEFDINAFKRVVDHKH